MKHFCSSALLLLAACGEAAQSSDTHAEPALTVVATFERTPLTRTQNVLRIRVMDLSSAQISDAQVQVTVSMPSHGHSVAAPVVAPNDTGEYVTEPFTFLMAGNWDVVVTAAKDSASGSQQLEASVP